MKKLFLKQCFLNPLATGSVTPSSQALTDLMVDAGECGRAASVVEVGPGTGAFTRTILQNISSETVFFAIEINPDFVRYLQCEYPDVQVYCDSVAELPRYLRKHQLKAVDLIFCGMPWAQFSPDVQDRLLGEIARALRPGGVFKTFAYAHALALPAARHFREQLNVHFRSVKKTKIVWSNVPPAFIYICHR